MGLGIEGNNLPHSFYLQHPYQSLAAETACSRPDIKLVSRTTPDGTSLKISRRLVTHQRTQQNLHPSAEGFAINARWQSIADHHTRRGKPLRATETTPCSQHLATESPRRHCAFFSGRTIGLVFFQMYRERRNASVRHGGMIGVAASSVGPPDAVATLANQSQTLSDLSLPSAQRTVRHHTNAARDALHLFGAEKT